ncbi:MAG: 16S rRNA (guanine527-N7)-methyltransferase [Flavobacteriales bacterium]|jgi:16S rRNA (guanine527-N7)-methyltransferase
MDKILKYFPNLSLHQIDQFKQLKPLYHKWNEQINVISRKDMDAFYERHVLHSLGIAKVHSFADGTNILDVGCGGGFPGIPLAILFPNCNFLLVDSIGKKIKVVNAVAESIGLKNLQAKHERAEKIDEKFHFVVSRAVTRMDAFVRWVKNSFLDDQHNELINGIFYLKGGDLSDELARFEKESTKIFELPDYFKESFFETKKVVYLPMTQK